MFSRILLNQYIDKIRFAFSRTGLSRKTALPSTGLLSRTASISLRYSTRSSSPACSAHATKSGRRLLSSSTMYTQLAEIPVPTNGQFLTRHNDRQSTVVQLSFSVKDHADGRYTKRNMSKSIIFPSFLSSSATGGSDAVDGWVKTPLAETGSVVLERASPSGRLRAVLRNDPQKNGGSEGRFVEVWKGDRVVVKVDVTDVHGDFYADEYLSGLSFSPAERTLVYVAELNPPSTTSSPQEDPYLKYRYKPDFGEGLTGKKRPAMFILRFSDIEEGNESSAKPTLSQLVVSGHEHILFGQPVFDTRLSSESSAQDTSSDGDVEVIYATGYEYTRDGRLLGIKGCFNRPSGIWRLQFRLSQCSTNASTLDTPTQSQTAKETNTETDTDVKAKSPSLVTASAQKLTAAHLSCRSPRIVRTSTAGDKLIWLATKSGGAHLSASALHALDLVGEKSVAFGDKALVEGDRAVVGFVKDPSSPSSASASSSPMASSEEVAEDHNNADPWNSKKAPTYTMAFPGLYPAYNLPLAPLVSPSQGADLVVLHSQWGTRTTVLGISIPGGRVWDLAPLNLNPNREAGEEQLYSWTVLATDGSNILCSRSSPGVPYEIVLGRVGLSMSTSGKDGEVEVDWVVVDRPELSGAVKNALSTIRTAVVPIPDDDGKIGLFETIVVQSQFASPTTTTTTTTAPGVGGSRPCITNPHGGPHAASSTAFSASASAFALDGYTLSQPNYTGSPGYGERFLRSLLGRCGSLDVEECMASANRLVEIGVSEEGKGKQLVMGGSHGGFLGVWLISRYPTFFSAAALRNPVVAPTEIASTDIPDWYFAEFGLGYEVRSSARSFEHSTPVMSDSASQSAPTDGSHGTGTNRSQSATDADGLMTKPIFEHLDRASPTRYIDNVRVPVLLHVGAVDRRVAPVHGIGLYHALKGRYAALKTANPNAGETKELEVDMLVFEGEGHPLDGVEASKIGYESIRDWFGRYRA